MKKQFLVACLIASCTIMAQTKPTTGVYQIPSKKGGPIAKIQFIELTPDKGYLKLNYTGPAPAHNMGLITDTIAVQNNLALYKTKEDPSCLVSFQFQGNGIQVKQESQAGSFACGFGRNVHVDGFYERTNATPVVPIKTGQHNLSLQWIGMQIPGNATITETSKGIYLIVGEQKGQDNDDYLRIAGKIFAVSERDLVFVGIIQSKVGYLNKGNPCIRNGVFNFKAAPNKKYWRLQEKTNCEGGMTVDYVDIFF